MAACKTQTWCLECGIESREEVCRDCRIANEKFNEEQAALMEEYFLDLEYMDELRLMDDDTFYDALEEDYNLDAWEAESSIYDAEWREQWN